MSKYTTTIQEYIQGVALADVAHAGNVPESMFPLIIEEMSEEDIHEIGRTLFPKSFPMYEESERENFMNAFIDHFYFYEIGQETVGQFKWYLKDFLNTRMPYYSQLYASRLTSLQEALTNMDLTRTENVNGTAHSSSTGTSSTTSSGEATDKTLQFPLNNQELEEVGRGVSNNSDTSSGQSSDTTDTTNTTTISATTRGIVSLNKVARTREYRELIFSINELIFEDAKDNQLFMQLW